MRSMSPKRKAFSHWAVRQNVCWTSLRASEAKPVPRLYLGVLGH